MVERISRSSSDDSQLENVRKRVCTACDRCRLKKSKCDIAKPCSRCRSDNAICVFGGRKKANEKAYPQGYAEKLEQQQVWLVHALQELYHCITEGEGWPGEHLEPKPNGHPLIHDLLARLGALDDFIGQRFEENTEVMRQRLWQQDVEKSCDDSFEDVQSPIVHSHVSFVASSQQNGSSNLDKQNTLPAAAQHALSSIQGDVNSPTTQREPTNWEAGNGNGNNFNYFDEMDMIPMPDYSNLVFDERIPPSMFPYQVLMDCVMPNEYEGLHQFGYSDPSEITSI
ncbi:C6 transcription factor [Penicillium sp. IBT 16267x]|nr:C6 transcription factor [Penicillium sp. IBT 16267x]